MVQSDVVCYFFVSSVSVLIEKIPVVRYLILEISIERLLVTAVFLNFKNK